MNLVSNAVSMNECAVCEQATECAICLCAPTGDTVATQCNHLFCKACLSRYIDTSKRTDCPMCKQSLSDADLEAAGVNAERRIALANEPPHALPPPTLSRLEERRFRQTARRLHMKHCPQCSAPIIKTAGCDHMRCGACQKNFSWRTARVVVPCHCLHFRSDLSGVAYFVNSAHTCRGCSPVATAKLWSWRTGLAVAALPVLALGAVVLPFVGAAELIGKARKQARRKAAMGPVRRKRGRNNHV